MWCKVCWILSWLGTRNLVLIFVFLYKGWGTPKVLYFILFYLFFVDKKKRVEVDKSS